MAHPNEPGMGTVKLTASLGPHTFAVDGATSPDTLKLFAKWLEAALSPEGGRVAGLVSDFVRQLKGNNDETQAAVDAAAAAPNP